MQFFVLLCCLSVLVEANDFIAFDYELDAYYSNISAFIDLDKNKTIEDGGHLSEKEIYTNLLYHSLHPNIFLVEISLNPMPILGVYFKKHYEKLDTLDLVKALTAGFEEPYALSFFIGRMMVFQTNNETHIGKNRAYIGVLVSVGDKSIKDNLLYNNRWYEVELKLKGTREQEYRDLDWSFRLGSRIHQNHDFVDSLYIGMRRSSIDYKKSINSLLYNSAYSVLVEFDKKTMQPIKSEFLLEKKFPISSRYKMVFGIEVGYLYTSSHRYRGVLQNIGVDNHQVVLRPNIKF